MAKQTPVERILIDSPHVKVRAEMLFNQLGIKTAKDLCRYTPAELKMQNVGPKTIDYIRACLATKGLGLKVATKQVVLDVLKNLSEAYPDAYVSPGMIVKEAYKYGAFYYNPADHQNVKAMLVKGGALENSVESVKIFVENRGGPLFTARVYRLKQSKQRGAK